MENISNGKFSWSYHIWSNASKSRCRAICCVEWNTIVNGATILPKGMRYGDRVQCCTFTYLKQGEYEEVETKKEDQDQDDV